MLHGGDDDEATKEWDSNTWETIVGRHECILLYVEKMEAGYLFQMIGMKTNKCVCGLGRVRE